MKNRIILAAISQYEDGTPLLIAVVKSLTEFCFDRSYKTLGSKYIKLKYIKSCRVNGTVRQAIKDTRNYTFPYILVGNYVGVLQFDRLLTRICGEEFRLMCTRPLVSSSRGFRYDYSGYGEDIYVIENTKRVRKDLRWALQTSYVTWYIDCECSERVYKTVYNLNRSTRTPVIINLADDSGNIAKCTLDIQELI